MNIKCQKRATTQIETKLFDTLIFLKSKSNNHKKLLYEYDKKKLLKFIKK
jgi:hypothetical protein